MSTATLHNEKKKTLIPELRFKEFDGEWEEKIMRDICKINQGLQIPISERFYEKADNNYFYITNEFLRKDSAKSYFIKNPSESVICYEADILMTRTGNTGQVVTNVHGAFHNNFFKIKYNSTCDKWFLYYFLTSYKTQGAILKLAGTSTIPDLNHGDFYKIAISIPTFPEQQKIASFLSAVDEKIQQLSRKKELLQQYKKGVMQKLFSGKLRFKDKNGKDFVDWEEKKLGDIGTLKNGLNKDKTDFGFGSPFVNLMNVFGKSEIYNQEFDLVNSNEKEKILYNVLKGDVLFIRSSVKRSGVGETVIVQEDLLNTVYSGFLIRFRDDRKSLAQEFKKYCFSSQSFRDEILSYATSSANTNINQESLNKINIKLPCIEEQQKIANFLSSIDAKIESASQQLNQTQSLKKGLLQKMFV